MMPMSDDALGGAVQWIGGVLLGSIATGIATLAVAAIGLLMLNGRLPVRRGVGVVLGCFILFSAPVITRGILAEKPLAPRDEPPPALAAVPAAPSVPPPAAPFDPYAGAALPTAPIAPAEPIFR